MSAAELTASPPIPFSRRRGWNEGSPISFLMKQGVENPGVISLAAGLVDAATLPVQEVGRASAHLVSHPEIARQALQYGTTSGYEPLRARVARHFQELEHRSGVETEVSASQILLTTGSQQFLSLVCEVLLDPGDICLVAGPTYFVFLGNLQGVGAEVVTVPADQDGMRMDLLEETLRELEAAGKLPKVKLIYLVSYYENPSGVSLSEERRRQVVEIAQQWSREQRILILEDAAYRELRYDGPELKSIYSCDPSRSSVLYTQTFSKTFSPGVRVGFGTGPEEVLSALADRKGNEDFGSANWNQHLLNDVLSTGAYRDHVRQVCSAYKIKRDVMLSACETVFRDIPGVRWVPAHGGLYVWVSLPETVETGFESLLFRTAVEEGVMYVPGELCYAGPLKSRPRHQMRLSFGVQQPAGIELGVQRLARAVSRIMNSR